MLPYKQAIPYLEKNDFFKKLNSQYSWVKYEEITIGYSIPMPYSNEKKMNAYYHLIECLEAKINLSKIPGEQIKSSQECLIKYLEKPFMNDLDTAPQSGLFRDCTLSQEQIMLLKMINNQNKE